MAVWPSAITHFTSAFFSREHPESIERGEVFDFLLRISNNTFARGTYSFSCGILIV